MRLAAALAALFCLVPGALAQPEFPDGGVVGRFEQRTASPGGYYLNAIEGEPTIRVNLVGVVARPGLYELGRGFDLVALLAMSGAPTDAPINQPGNPDVYVKMFRVGESGRRSEIFSEVIDDVLASPSVAPGLREGDIVEVVTRPSASVYVWGAVRQPGLFEIGPEVDLRAALALAGGPVLAPLDTRIERTVFVRVYRTTGGTEGLLIETTLDEFVSGAVALPEPRDGDTILVETLQRTKLSFRDIVSGVGAAAAVATAIILGIDRLGGSN